MKVGLLRQLIVDVTDNVGQNILFQGIDNMARSIRRNLELSLRKNTSVSLSTFLKKTISGMNKSLFIP